MNAVLAQSDDAVGVYALINPDAELRQGDQTRIPQVGDDVLLNDRLSTDEQGQMHLMLVDKSSFTIGPNSDITIDEFVYDADTRAGSMALSAARGVMRFVGGDISKQNPVEIQTSVGTLGIRGGIATAEINADGSMLLFFAYGSAGTFTSNAGVTSSIARTGFMMEISSQGIASAPVPAPADVINRLNAGLEAGPSTPAAPTGDQETGTATPVNQPAPGSAPTDQTIVATVTLDTSALGISEVIEQDGELLAETDLGTIVAVEDIVTEQIATLTQTVQEQIDNVQVQQVAEVTNNQVEQILATVAFTFRVYDYAAVDDQVSIALFSNNEAIDINGNAAGNILNTQTDIDVYNNEGNITADIYVDKQFELIVNAVVDGGGGVTIGADIINDTTISNDLNLVSGDNGLNSNSTDVRLIDGNINSGNDTVAVTNAFHANLDDNPAERLTVTGTINEDGDVTVTGATESDVP